MKSRTPPTDLARLQHVLLAIMKLERFVGTMTEAEFIADERTVEACTRQFQNIGEAGNRLTTQTLKLMPETPWKQIVGLRHILVHDYYEVDERLLWRTIQQHIQPLRQQVVRAITMLEALSNSPNSHI